MSEVRSSARPKAARFVRHFGRDVGITLCGCTAPIGAMKEKKISDELTEEETAENYWKAIHTVHQWGSNL